LFARSAAILALRWNPPPGPSIVYVGIVLGIDARLTVCRSQQHRVENGPPRPFLHHLLPDDFQTSGANCLLGGMPALLSGALFLPQPLAPTSHRDPLRGLMLQRVSGPEGPPLWPHAFGPCLVKWRPRLLGMADQPVFPRAFSQAKLRLNPAGQFWRSKTSRFRPTQAHGPSSCRPPGSPPTPAVGGFRLGGGAG